MRYACALALALALLIVPAAGAAGITFGYTVTSGTAGDNGWYRSAVTVQITVQGQTGTTCPTSGLVTFSSNSDVLDCTATDGNATIPFHLQFKIDTVAPIVTGATPNRSADANGWFNQPVTIAFTGSDAISGLASCTSSSYGGSDSAAASISGTCRDNAGNVSAAGSFALKYDATAPSVTPTADRVPDGADWYNHPVTVAFAGSDATSGIDSCTAPTTYAGPDAASTALAGTCVDHAGNRATGSLALKYDGTPPTVAAALARKPDERGWYTRPVAVTFSGSDALSGLSSCTAAKTYSGPDAAEARLTGECHDNAGNAAPASVSMKYDATAPRLQDVTAAPGAGDVTLTWRQPADIARVAVTRSPGRNGSAQTVIYNGKAPRVRDTRVEPGVTYHYKLASLDEAGNRAVADVTTKLRTLYSPAPGSRARAGDVLRWTVQKDATYYNVQLFRGGRKVLSTWPVGTSLRLPRTWSYSGHNYRLSRGAYRWYVWPGRGARTHAQYGPLLGSSSFTVR